MEGEFQDVTEQFYATVRQNLKPTSKTIDKYAISYICGEASCSKLYYRADEGRLRKVANAFGVSRSTVSLTIRRACFVTSTILGPEYIKLPQTEHDVLEAVSNFYDRHGFPQCIGAVDGTHIFINLPTMQVTLLTGSTDTL